MSVLLLWLCATKGLAEEPGTCINTDEAELLQLVDELFVEVERDKDLTRCHVY